MSRLDIDSMTEFSELRSKAGADRWDEVWDGLLHMTPSPTPRHQMLLGELFAFLRQNWAKPNGAQVLIDVNVSPSTMWKQNYRVPDLSLISADRLNAIKANHVDSAPNAIVEIRSPDDESIDKLGFYFDFGVAEVWVIDRDTCALEIYVRGNGGYLVLSANPEGWSFSPEIGIEMRTLEPGRMAIRLAQRPETVQEIP